ncbi:50S ribosomal protein L14e [Candidatus Micrarchaeota archaeon]|nr:50S ribosomal protein L14e [Candidatus Micrarchaeota archaeon]
MPAIDVGSVCIKTTGRDANMPCVITKVINENTVEVLSKGRKNKRKCSIRHLQPLGKKIEVTTDAEVKKSLAKIS